MKKEQDIRNYKQKYEELKRWVDEYATSEDYGIFGYHSKQNLISNRVHKCGFIPHYYPSNEIEIIYDELQKEKKKLNRRCLWYMSMSSYQKRLNRLVEIEKGLENYFKIRAIVNTKLGGK